MFHYDLPADLLPDGDVQAVVITPVVGPNCKAQLLLATKTLGVTRFSTRLKSGPTPGLGPLKPLDRHRHGRRSRCSSSDRFRPSRTALDNWAPASSISSTKGYTRMRPSQHPDHLSSSLMHANLTLRRGKCRSYHRAMRD